MTGRERVLAEAEKLKGVAETPAGSNRGLVIDFMLWLVGSPLGSPWCAAFVALCGVLALGRGGWPFTLTGSVQELAVRHSDRITRRLADVRPGDLFLLHYPTLGRYGHVGIVRAVRGDAIETWEGNTNDAGSREGYRVASKVRPVTARMAFLTFPEADT